MTRRTSVTLLALLVAAVLVAAQASAKEGMVARVLTPIDREAEPGTRVTVVWDLFAIVDGKRHAFGGGDVFIRFFGAGESRSRRVPAEPIREGRYRARVSVPSGGVRRVVIALMGTACDWSGCRPKPIRFRILGDPFR